MRTFLILAFLVAVTAASPNHDDQVSEDREDSDYVYYDYGDYGDGDYHTRPPKIGTINYFSR